MYYGYGADGGIVGKETKRGNPRDWSVDILDLSTLQSMVYNRHLGKGISIKFEDGATTAKTDGRTITLPTPMLPISREQLDLLYGYMVHEAGHLTREKAFDILRSIELDPSHPLRNIFNMVEDMSMEREVSRHHYGDKLALAKGMTKHIDSMLVTYDAHKELMEHPEQAKIMAVYALGLGSRADWDPYTLNNLEKYNKYLAPNAETLGEELLNEGWLGRLRDAESVDEAWDVSCDLYKRLYPEDPDTEKIREQGKKPPPPDAEKSKKKDGVGKGDKPEGMGENGSGEGSMEGTLIKYPWTQLVHSPHEDNDGNPYGAPAVIDWTGHGDEWDRVRLLDQKDIRVVKDWSGAPTISPYNNASINDGASSLANAIRIYIQASKRNRYTPEQYRGKIAKRAIARLAFPPIDGGEWNKKIFYINTKTEYKDTAIGILTDWSGSMNGQKKVVAVQATCRLAHVFDTQLQVPTFISAFSTGSSKCVIGLIKDFHEKDTTINTISRRFSSFDKYTSGNADADSLAWMYHQMEKRPEERKIIIVLSDGAPTDGHHLSSADTTLKYMCQAIEKRKGFDLIGIGIQSDQVERYYKNRKVIDSLSELDSTLLTLLKEVYVSGKKE